jgi:translation initiation factor 2 subunit 3
MVEKKIHKEQKEKKKEKELDSNLIPEINIGMVGHVDHGKTSLTSALTGKWTDTHSEEIKRGITIRLGYADATFYKCPKCTEPECYGTTPKCQKCFSECKPLRTVSFVDAPGHETLMATVLSGAAIMDGAILVISAHEACPQPQTREHLTVLDIAGIKKIVVVQNKIDIVPKEDLLKNYKQIKEFLKGSVAENAPIIPISAQQSINIDALIEAIETTIATPKRDSSKNPKMLIARSFDINKPGTPIGKLRGGVLGGSLMEGQLEAGQEVEIRPGIKIKDVYESLTTKITGLQKAMKDLKNVGPGGLMGISTELDPYLTKSDLLSGNILGLPGKLPPVLGEITVKTHLLDRVVGSKEELRVDPIRSGDPLMLTVATSRTVGVVAASKGDTISVKLKIPVCADPGERVAVSRQIMGRWRLIGWGEIA